MKSLHFGWLLLAAIPGCILVQPLDGAASSDSSSSAAGSTSGSHAGSGNSHAGSPGSAGSPGGRAGAPGASGAPGTSGATSIGGKLAPFLGTWTLASGSLTTITCPGLNPLTEAATGVETWVPGAASDLVMSSFEGNCDFKANVSGRTALGLSGQSCVVTSTDASTGDDLAQDLSFDSFKFVVSADGKSATQTFSGTDDYADLTTSEYAICTFTETATLTM